MTFQIDKSGYVEPPFSRDRYAPLPFYWSDLDAFTQGYVEAIAAWLYERHIEAYDPLDGGLPYAPRFSDLAPETLARIIADCERWQGLYPKGRPGHEGGAHCWELRQAQHVERPDFPRQTVQLGDDGKVRFAKPASEPAQ